MDFGNLGEPRSGRSAERPQAGRKGCGRTKERDRDGHERAGAEEHGAQRDQAGQRRASSQPRSAPQSLLSSHMRMGCSSKPLPALPVAPPPPPATPTEKRTKSGGDRRSPPVGAGPRAGPVRSAAPALKDPPLRASTAHARPWGGEGPEAAGARSAPRAGVQRCRRGAERSFACQCPRDPGRGAGRVQDPGAVPSGGRGRLGQALTAARFKLSEPPFQGGLSAAQGNGIAGARARATDVAGWRMPLCLVRSRAGGQSGPGATLPVRTRTSSPAFLCYPLRQTIDPSRSCTFVSRGGLFGNTNGTF